VFGGRPLFFFLGLLSAWLGGGPQHDRDDAMFAVG
jgi:hypothetical protein